MVGSGGGWFEGVGFDVSADKASKVGHCLTKISGI